MPFCYQLVGIPGSGKTTWVNAQPWAKNYVIVSTDNFIEAYAKEVGSTYNDVFNHYMPIAVKLMTEQVIDARSSNKDIIWDQTSTTVESRRKKFNMLPDYTHIAVVFEKPPIIELMKRLASRPGKNIPRHVISNMINNFEMPTMSEGFVEVKVI